MWSQGRLYFAWLLILLASACCLFIPFMFAGKAHEPPRLEWSPGYWEVLPKIGLARIVPFARARLVNPATGAGPAQIREPASKRLAPKY